MVVFWYLCTKYRVSNPYYLERGRKLVRIEAFVFTQLLVTHITSRGDGNYQIEENDIIPELVTHITSRGDGNFETFFDILYVLR